MLPVVVGAPGTIPNAIKGSLKETKFSKIEINKLLRKLQNNSIRGTIKICKTLMNMNLGNDKRTNINERNVEKNLTQSP